MCLVHKEYIPGCDLQMSVIGFVRVAFGAWQLPQAGPTLNVITRVPNIDGFVLECYVPYQRVKCDGVTSESAMLWPAK